MAEDNTGATGGTGGGGIVILKYPESDPVASGTTGSPTVFINNSIRYYVWTTSGSITF
jgi:hypothetical protein